VPPVLIWALVAHSYTSSSQVASNVKIFMPEKRLGQFEFQKVHEMSKYTKQVFPVMLSYNQNKGDRWKIPINKHKTLL
jgi:hypothetical protein